MKSTVALNSQLPFDNKYNLFAYKGLWRLRNKPNIIFFSKFPKDTLKWNPGHTNQNTNSNKMLQTCILSKNSKNRYNNIVDI